MAARGTVLVRAAIGRFRADGAVQRRRGEVEKQRGNHACDPRNPDPFVERFWDNERHESKADAGEHDCHERA